MNPDLHPDLTFQPEYLGQTFYMEADESAPHVVTDETADSVYLEGTVFTGWTKKTTLREHLLP